MTAPSFRIAPPGWYTDPGNPARQRWFDGTRWTTRVQATPAPAPVTEPPPIVSAPPAFASAPAARRATPQFGAPTPHDPDHDASNQSGKHAPVTNTPARIALVVSIIAMLGVPVAAVAGIVLAVIGLRRATSLESAGGTPLGRTRARWALGLSVVGAVIGAIVVTGVVRATLADDAPDGSTDVIDTLAIELGISAGMAGETGVATTVQCPEDLAAAAGTSFQCVATDPDGGWTIVDVQIVDATGTWTWELR